MSSLPSILSDSSCLGIFNDSFPPILDGVTLTVDNYARWLQHGGNKVCVVTPWNPSVYPADYQVLKYFSIPIVNRRPYRYGYPKLDPFIWSRLRRTPFAIAHAHCPFSSGRLGVYVKKYHKVPLIGTFHSKYRSDLEHSFKKLPFCVPIIMKRILDFFNACDEVWIPQAQVEETVREYGYKGALTVVENGNDFASIIKGDIFDYKKDARRRLGISESEIALLFVGQHIWEKGVDVVIDALEKLNGKVKFRMNFIGNGYAAQEIAERVKAKGLSEYVTMHGVISSRETLADWYAASDLFLFPSFYDNAPLVIREAAAMGTPAVLLEGSTASEVIRNGVNGFLTGRSADDFAAMIASLSADRDRLRHVALGARNSLVRSWENVVEEVADRYSSIILQHSNHESYYSLNCR